MQFYLAPPSSIETLERAGRSATPTRRRRKSSSAGRRSHSEGSRLRSLAISEGASGVSARRCDASSMERLIELFDGFLHLGSDLCRFPCESPFASTPVAYICADRHQRDIRATASITGLLSRMNSSRPAPSGSRDAASGKRALRPRPGGAARICGLKGVIGRLTLGGRLKSSCPPRCSTA